MLTPAGVDSYTPAPTHLWNIQLINIIDATLKISFCFHQPNNIKKETF